MMFLSPTERAAVARALRKTRNLHYADMTDFEVMCYEQWIMFFHPERVKVGRCVEVEKEDELNGLKELSF